MSQVTNLIYIPDTPFGPGNSWTLIVVAPSGGSGQVSLDGGVTWITSSIYNSTYGGFELKCQDGVGTEWLTSTCMPINGTGFAVIRARKGGEEDYKLIAIGQGEQIQGGDGFAYAYSAYCTGSNIIVTFAVQYATASSNNYQLSQSDTQRVRLSLNGVNITAIAEYVDACTLSCHWTRVFATQSIPVLNFPLVAVFSDVTSTVPPWNATVTAGNIGDPCVVTTPVPVPVPTPVPVPVPVPTPVPVAITATAVVDVLVADTGESSTVNVSTNDVLCSSGLTSFAIINNAVNGVATITSQGLLTYTSTVGFVGNDVVHYGLFCNGVLISRSRVSISVVNNDECYGESLCPTWESTGVTDCQDGLEITRYVNTNTCVELDDNYEWRVTGKCKKKCGGGPCAPVPVCGSC